MRALTDLIASHLHTVVPARLQHRLTELLRTVRVGPLPDRQVRGVLTEGDVLVQRGGTGLGARVALGRCELAGAVDDGLQVRRRRTAAAADEGEAVVPDEVLLGVGESVGAEREVRTVLGEDRQAGVRHAHQRRTRMTGEIAQVLAHLVRTRRAVQPDQINTQRLQSGQGRADLGAQEHDAGGLEGEGADQRHLNTQRVHRPARPDDARLRLQQILGGLHDQRVGAAREEALRVLLVTVAQDVVRDVAERGQLGAGADRAEDPPLAAVLRTELIRDLAGDPGTRLGQLVDPVGDLILIRRRMVRTKRVRLHTVDTDREVLLMHRPHDVGPRDVQDLVAAFEILKILQRRVLCLEHGAHRPVGHHHTCGECLSEGVCAGPAVGGGCRQRGHG